MSQFLQSLESEIQLRGLLPRRQKILVAVSGGADSLVLLHALASLAAKFRWKLTVAHFNHQLRGRASAADEQLVRQTAAALKLPVVVACADVKAFAKKSKFSIEMAARKLRHEFFARTAKPMKISVVALAHHADDQVELFFLRVLRGAGGEGLAGMRWRSPSPAEKTIVLVRPLLGLTKTELLDYASENKIRFREDATNSGSDFLRNRIRNELLPLLQKKYQPGLAKTVLRLMEIVGAESEFIGAVAQQWLGDKSGPQNTERGEKIETPHVIFDSFEKLSLAVQRKVLQRQLAELGVAADFYLIEQLRKSPLKPVCVGPNLTAVRNAAGKIKLREPIKSGFKTDEIKLSVRAGRAEFGGREFHWQIWPQKKDRFQQENLAGGPPALREFFDADRVGCEITLRHWQAGDRFQPMGLRSPVKLQDLFVNAKIPRERRRELVVAATAAGEVFWVEGLRMSEPFKLTAATQQRLVWAWGPV